MNKIFSTKISERQGQLFEVGLLLNHDGCELWWRAEVRLLDSNGHPVGNGAITLDEKFAEAAHADNAGIRAAHSLIEERSLPAGNQ